MEFSLENALTGAVFGTIYVLVRLVEYLIKRRNINDDSCALSKREHEWLKSLYDIHERRDENGVPLVYVPRSLIALQKEILTQLTNISRLQEKTSYVLDHIISKIGVK